MPSPISPPARRGMLLRLGASQAPPWGLVFPFNPESLHRALIAADTGRPQETITFTLRLDATDALGDRDPLSTQVGLHPQVAVLERLLRAPIDGGVTLFSWGSRVLPVVVTGLAVNETLFDTALNPIRADVEVTLRVLAEGAKGERTAELLEANEQWHEHMAAQVRIEPQVTGPPGR
jgi:hypothetical protein